jgi:hypothetical protein
MKSAYILLFSVGLFICGHSQTVKSKPLKVKYSTPEGWSAREFGGPTSWDESGGDICKCAGVMFTKDHKNGKMHVLVYPSTATGLDSAKRSYAGPLRWELVEKYEKTTNKNFSFEKRRSNFTDTKAGSKSYEVIRYKAKVDDHFYLIYAWQENMGILNPTVEKELNEMVNAIEPL